MKSNTFPVDGRQTRCETKGEPEEPDQQGVHYESPDT